MNRITIVIPNYNGIKFIEECLASVLAQEQGTPDYGVVVVDNGSQDGSPDLIRRKFPQVSLISLDTNTGFCHAVNVGIRAADTPYVILLNNDTKSHPHFVRGLYDAMEARPGAFSVSAKMLMWDRPDLIDDAGDRYCVLGWAYARGKGRPAAEYDKPEKVFSACGGAAIYRKSVFDEIGLFDEAHFAYLEDLDIGYRALLYGYENYYEPSAQVIHYGSACSGSRYNEWKTIQAAANSVYVIAKNMPFFQRLWNSPFLALGFLIKFLFFCRKGMGRAYLKGLKEGIAKSVSHTGSGGKKFPGAAADISGGRKRFSRYCALQWQFYANTLRLLKKS